MIGAKYRHRGKMSQAALDRIISEFDHLWPGVSIPKYIGATSLLTIGEVILLYPIELITVRLQVSPLPQTFFQSFATTFRSQYESYGFRRGLYHGLTYTILASVPVNILYLAAYNSSLKQLEKRKDDLFLLPSVLLPGVAGAVAEVSSVVLKVPQDIITQKLQTQGLEQNISAKQYIKSVWNEKRMYGFFTGTGATLATLLPGGMLWWISFEAIKKQLNKFQNIREEDAFRNLSFGNLVIASSFAGIVASSLVNPFDICKTRIQTEMQCYGKRNTLSVMGQLIKHEGIASLSKGLIGRIGISIPTSVIGGVSYEVIIHFASNQGRDK